jgi:hypothetical protein
MNWGERDVHEGKARVPAALTALESQIADEERIVGIPTDQPLTDAAIVRRHTQVGVLFALVTFVALATLATSASSLRVFTSALGLMFGVYAVRKERHLQRLARLHRDECSIHLTVADSLLRSGVLRADRELLDLRTAVETGASGLAADLLDVVPAECAALRLIGPSGETPLAAVCDQGDHAIRLDPAAAHEALRRREPIRQGARDGRTVIAVPLEHQHHVLGVLEVISGPASFYSAYDAELVSVFAYGAVSGLLSGRRTVEAP